MKLEKIKLIGDALQELRLSVANTKEKNAIFADENAFRIFREGEVRPLPQKRAQPSQINFSDPGTYDFVVPDGVFAICVFCIGAGGGGGRGGTGGSYNWSSGAGGGAGGSSYENFVSVSSGDIVTVTVGEGGEPRADGQNSSVRYKNNNIVIAYGGKLGGSSSAFSTPGPSEGGSGNYRQGSSGGGGGLRRIAGGSGGSSSGSTAIGIIAGAGGKGGDYINDSRRYGSKGENGGVRIIWGEDRYFPTTNTQNV